MATYAQNMKAITELISELERVRREYPALVHAATTITLNAIEEVVKVTRHGIMAKEKQLASESPELGWHRFQHKYGVDWVGKTGKTVFRMFCVEKFEPNTDEDLGPVCFLPPVQVIEPEDLKDYSILETPDFSAEVAQFDGKD